jgi:hypothetical protein
MLHTHTTYSCLFYYKTRNTEKSLISTPLKNFNLCKGDSKNCKLIITQYCDILQGYFYWLLLKLQKFAHCNMCNFNTKSKIFHTGFEYICMICLHTPVWLLYIFSHDFQMENYIYIFHVAACPVTLFPANNGLNNYFLFQSHISDSYIKQYHDCYHLSYLQDSHGILSSWKPGCMKLPSMVQ